MLQRGPNGELEEVTQTEELQVEGNESEEHLSEEPPLPLATIIEETTEVCLAVYLLVCLFVCLLYLSTYTNLSICLPCLIDIYSMCVCFL